ncbi:N-methyl-L-tryptophan oxidase [Paenibacillus tyrfis]|nr:N-methyl-L-tryptophan oxidase [Paenibacillus tyrfis]
MTVIRTSYDVIVIGAGSMGMSAGAHLAGRGISTLLIDAFDPPHGGGSHHGETRLLRHAYAGGGPYAAMAVRAHRLWSELEEERGRKLFFRSGVLNMAPAGHSGLRDKLESSAALQLLVELLRPEEIAKRWPGVQLPDDYAGLFEPEAGYLLSEQCVQAYRETALAHRAALLPYTRVTEVVPGNAGVTVKTGVGDFYADRLIVSAGAGVGSVLLPSLAPPVAPVRKAVAWFQADEALFASERFPGFTLSTPDGGFYGFPSIQGSGVKIGRHETGLPLSPVEQPADFGTLPEDEGDLRRALETYMPAAAGGLLRGGVCKYELSPDEHFIIDRAPFNSNIQIACGFSGHGFKFASVVGEILADRIEGKPDAFDLSMFRLSRFQEQQVVII